MTKKCDVSHSRQVVFPLISRRLAVCLFLLTATLLTLTSEYSLANGPIHGTLVTLEGETSSYIYTQVDSTYSPVIDLENLEPEFVSDYVLSVRIYRDSIMVYDERNTGALAPFENQKHVFPPFTPPSIGDYRMQVTFQAGSQNTEINVTLGVRAGPCLNLVIDPYFGIVDHFDTVVHSGSIENPNDSPAVFSLDLYGGRFLIEGGRQFDTLLPHDTRHFNVRLLTGMSGGDFSASLVAEVRAANGGTPCTIVQRLYADTAFTALPLDRIPYSLLGEEPVTLTLSENYRLYQFWNTSESDLEVTAVGLENGTDLKASAVLPPSYSGLPIVVYKNEALIIRLDLTTTNPGTYSDELIITTRNALTSARFPIVATQAKSKVEETRNREVVRITNAAQHTYDILVTNAFAYRIEVRDILGRPMPLNGSRFRASQPGSYFVRVAGRRGDGYPFLITRQILIR